MLLHKAVPVVGARLKTRSDICQLHAPSAVCLDKAEAVARLVLNAFLKLDAFRLVRILGLAVLLLLAHGPSERVGLAVKLLDAIQVRRVGALAPHNSGPVDGDKAESDGNPNGLPNLV